MSRSRYRLLPAFVLVAVVGCGGQPAPDTKPEPVVTTPAPTTAAKPEVDPNAPSGERTLAYWQEVGKLQELTARRYAALAEPKPAEVSKHLTDMAKAIDALPTEKVDPDAITVGKMMAEVLRWQAAGKAEPAAQTTVASKARAMKATFTTRYGRDFPSLDVADTKEPVLRLVRDLGRPPLTQELARLKGEVAKLDTQLKPVNQKLTDETSTKDKLQSEADSVRAILKEQTSDADLKKLRQDVLDDAVKQLDAKKKEIDELMKQVNALRTKKSNLDRVVVELAAVLTEGEPTKAEALTLDRLERLRVQSDRVYDKIDAQKATGK